MEVSLGKSLINGPGIQHANGQYTVNTGDEFQLTPGISSGFSTATFDETGG